MKFAEQLHTAILHGTVQFMDGKITVPADMPLSKIFPSYRNIKKSSFYKAMQRAGYKRQNGVWITKEVLNSS